MESTTIIKKYKKINGVVVEDVEQRFINGELVYNKSKTKSLKNQKECCGECHKDNNITANEDITKNDNVEYKPQFDSYKTDKLVHELLSETDDSLLESINTILEEEELLTLFKSIHPRVKNDIINKVISLDVRLGDKLKKSVYDDPQARTNYLNKIKHEKETQSLKEFEDIITLTEDYISNNDTLAGFKGHTDQSTKDLIKEVVDVDSNVDIFYVPSIYLKFSDGEVERYDIIPNNHILINEYKKLFSK